MLDCREKDFFFKFEMLLPSFIASYTRPNKETDEKGLTLMYRVLFVFFAVVVVAILDFSWKEMNISRRDC